jgi:hypothetical protein
LRQLQRRAAARGAGRDLGPGPGPIRFGPPGGAARWLPHLALARRAARPLRLLPLRPGERYPELSNFLTIAIAYGLITLMTRRLSRLFERAPAAARPPA